MRSLSERMRSRGTHIAGRLTHNSTPHMKLVAKYTLNLLAAAVAVTAFAAEPASPAGQPRPSDPEVVGEETAVLTAAPNVPTPIQRRHATKVIVRLEVREVVK